MPTCVRARRSQLHRHCWARGAVHCTRSVCAVVLCDTVLHRRVHARDIGVRDAFLGLDLPRQSRPHISIHLRDSEAPRRHPAGGPLALLPRHRPRAGERSSWDLLPELSTPTKSWG